MKRLILLHIFYFFTVYLYQQNDIALFNIDSNGNKSNYYRIEFKNQQELKLIIDTSNVQYNSVVIHLTKDNSIPNSFFSMKNLEYIQLTMETNIGLSSKFRNFKNLKALEIKTPKLICISNCISNLPFLRYIDIMTEYEIDKKIWSKAKHLVSISKSDSLTICSNINHCIE
jgi:hypothetical protein